MRVFNVVPQPWLALCFALGAGAALPSFAAEPAPDGHTARYEINFMEDMVDHHTMAIEMSRLCQSRAVHAELTELCTNIVTSQQQERQRMQNWLRDWYEIDKEPRLTEQERDELAHLATLSGAEFERNYLKRIIPHHFIAVRDAAECEVRVYHGELRDMCRDAIIMQAEEIDTTRDWLCEWYGICALDMRLSAVVDRPEGESPRPAATTGEQNAASGAGAPNDAGGNNGNGNSQP